MVFSWLRNRRRRRLVAEQFAAPWYDILERNVLYYRTLTETEQAKLRDDLRILIAEKNWEGCGGLRLDDEIRVTIAAQIAILLLGFDGQYFPKVQSILVYPDAYVAPDTVITKGGVVLEGDSAREGEAWYRGPVVLSWADALAGGRGESGGDNLVFHEFAHQWDMQNGRHVDGIPPLESRAQYQRWTAVINQHYQQLILDCQHGRHTLLDCYGATHISEFFAVTTETFFQRPRALRRRHPELYEIFRLCYRQDPAER
jgi:Mlc titration factor MtfA (ptsG expression regulator)